MQRRLTLILFSCFIRMSMTGCVPVSLSATNFPTIDAQYAFATLSTVIS
ncbi:hypothetical protein IQ266_04435 [filamentous cyanobacterium LEGE 11480]|uniref:Uncharacterized protein n=1 Tax=Romeriopsis navalis LEGE 11480 TaxID=2777977 RepID=A0A928VN37_9CYAN|nr:hypothetical protein [Romeriopsis navalis]MBE9029009.1 hypothetical protein [Romeriopsis navalis LEGE 11480]